MDDKEIEEVLLNLGLKISKPPQAQEKFHILTTSPQNFPILEIIRPQDSSRFYLIVMEYRNSTRTQKRIREHEDR